MYRSGGVASEDMIGDEQKATDIVVWSDRLSAKDNTNIDAVVKVAEKTVLSAKFKGGDLVGLANKQSEDSNAFTCPIANVFSCSHHIS